MAYDATKEPPPPDSAVADGSAAEAAARPHRQDVEPGPSPQEARHRPWLKILGPGLITGASDDDPSGIATYSQAGALFAYGMLWTAVFTFPFMAAIQEISARIGRVTGRGIAANIRKYYPPWLLYPIVALLVFANVINLGADIGAMGEAAHLMFGAGHAVVYAAMFAVVSILLQVFVKYTRYTNLLKWLAVALLAYVGTAFMAHVEWGKVARGTFLPHLRFDAQSISMFIAVVGTTISPYLFFWQSSLESEEVTIASDERPLKNAPRQARPQLERIRVDTYLGMAFSNLIAFFIILTAAVTIGQNPELSSRGIQSAQDAAEGLRQALGPQGAGRYAFFLFSMGIIGTGLLAIPTLAGSAAYAVGEALKWPTGMDREPLEAKGFYAIITVATLLGLAMNLIKSIDPMKALVWSAVLNGIVSVPVMIVMMLMVSNQKVMGKFTLIGRTLKLMGWLATAVMAVAVIGLFATWGK